MSDQLPEVREVDASPEVAAIYEDIRATIGIPLVNLIYRHLATIPGALPWVWQIARQPIASDAFEAARARLISGLDLPALEPLEEDTARLSRRDVEAINGIVHAYNRGNTTNLLVLTAVRALLDEGTTTRSPTPVPSDAPAPGAKAPLAALPPFPRLTDLSPETVAVLRSLAGQHGKGDTAVIPSLYLHLAHWPGALVAVRDRLRPLFEEGRLDRATEEARARASLQAATLRSRMQVATLPPADGVAKIRHALDLFTGRVILSMVPIGQALRTLFTRAR